MSVTDAAIARIRDLITSGVLSPGDRLPPEQELAAQLNLSRSSLREAVKALSQAKVLSVRRGDGTYVTSLKPDELLSGLSFAVDLLQDHQLAEVFEVRKLLEPAATALAALRITPEGVAQLRDSLDSMKHATDPESLIKRDMDFHSTVVRITGNTTLASILDVISVRAMRARIWRASMSGLKSMTLAHHALIVDALEQHDPELARSAATVHLSASASWLSEFLANPSARPAPSDQTSDDGLLS